MALATTHVRNGVECIIPDYSPGKFFILSEKNRVQRLYISADNLSEAVETGRYLWGSDTSTELYEDRGNKKPKKIRIP